MKIGYINVQELEAVRRALLILVPDLNNEHELVQTDSTTAAAFINRMGGVKSRPCACKARAIWHWLLERNCWMTAQFLPGIENVVADRLSRELSEGTEWQLDPKVFQALCVHFEILPTIDLFAAANNTQLTNYMSYKYDPNAVAEDALIHPWESYKICYAFPPFSLVSRVVQRLRREPVVMLLVVPWWKTMTWFNAVMQLVVRMPVVIPPTKRLLRHPADPLKVHPLLPKMKLLGLVVSSSAALQRAYRQQPGTSSWPPGAQTQGGSTLDTLQVGSRTAVSTTSIH